MKYYQVSEQNVSSKLANETIILDIQHGKYFGLNEVGTFIWEQLRDSQKSEKDLEILLLENYDIDKESVNRDLKEILTQLINEKLVKEV